MSCGDMARSAVGIRQDQLWGYGMISHGDRAGSVVAVGHDQLWG